MTHPSIHPETKIGAVHLTVSNLDRSLDFYRNTLGFKLHQRNGDIAYLGAGGGDLITLTELAGARKVWGTTGLYHFAVLLPTRRHLAQVLQKLTETRTPLEGFADHWVSEAIYLPDPDGNGIEIYRDRPREEWPRDGDRLLMATDPLDVQSLVAELENNGPPWNGLPPGATIGHIHLHVADLEKAEEFYHKVLGFDLVARLGSAAGFVSAGGYHHHIGFNTWAGVGAPPPPPNSLGLRYFEILLPNQEELVKVTERLREAELRVEQQKEGLLVRDPSQNEILLTVNSSFRAD